jgi:predicted ribosomally synthesized peptide with SipW-like signal peptide
MGKLSVVLFLLLTVVVSGKIQGTNAAFTDTAMVSGNTFTAGYWIPTLHMSVNPAVPDGEDGFYKTTPCVTLTADINGVVGGTTIYYKFSNDGDPVTGGLAYLGSCIPIPDGDPTHFEAVAVNNDNANWKSAVTTREFQVDTLNVVKSGDVVINEVMWMGSSGNEKDQWVELRNTTDHDIHIDGWYLTYRSNADNENKLLEIPDNRVIKKGGYYLASYYIKNNSAIKVTPDSDDMNNFGYEKFQIKLYASSAKTSLIDTAGSGDRIPTKGDKDHFYSMERDNIPGEGDDYDNWYTCLDNSDTMKSYWDDDRTERGTPGAKNLSKNDPTSPEYDPNYTGDPEVVTETLTDNSDDEKVVSKKVTIEEKIDDKGPVASDETLVSIPPTLPDPQVSVAVPTETEVLVEIKEELTKPPLITPVEKKISEETKLGEEKNDKPEVKEADKKEEIKKEETKPQETKPDAATKE